MKRLSIVLAVACAAVACNPTSLRPGYCHTNKDCPSSICHMATRTCEPLDASMSDTDASDTGPWKCMSNQDCVDRADGGVNNVCNMDNGKCEECLSDDHCLDAPKPICNLTTLVCERCTTDSQCAAKVPSPGICMFHQDGRCATDGETIYVKNSTGCSMSAGVGGTKDMPFCSSQDGVNAAAQGRSLVVMRGPDALTEWSVTAVPIEPITVVGQSSAAVSPGARIGVRVSAGNVYIRGLKISGGSSTGVVAEPGAELHMDACIVESNAAGGIKIDGAAFDITNTVVAKNGSTATTGCGAWAGVCLNSTVAASRFLNNTVVSNVGPGIACASGVAAIDGSIISANTPDVSLCTVNPCCTNPALTPDYHLMSGSPCIDQVDSVASTARDFEGQLRPRGSKSDCGADEF